MLDDITKHLDLGCGSTPRNPYNQTKVYGIDIRENLACNVVKANISIDSIPFEDNFFDSISAYDFLEHIPRVIVDIQNSKTIFSFINLMNEIHRVLKPNGKFYASTPAFPSHKAFVDPTHVNFISRETHAYFIGPAPMAKMYGFNGSFELVRAKFYRPKYDYEPWKPDLQYWFKQQKNILKKRRSHMLWEFKKTTTN